MAFWSFILGNLAYALGVRRRVVLDNLERAFPEKSSGERRTLARRVYLHMARAVLDGAFAPRHISDAELATALVSDDWSKLEQALAQGRGVVLATAHFGSWERLGHLLSRRGLPMHAVVRPLRGAFNARIVRARTAYGLKLIPPQGALSRTLTALRENGVVAFLIDQGTPAKSALHVPFFGRSASVSPAFAYAARRSGAPVVLAMAVRHGNQLRLRLEGPFPAPDTGDLRADLTAHAATVTSAMEKWIRAYPDQWLWLHRRWKHPPAVT